MFTGKSEGMVCVHSLQIWPFLCVLSFETNTALLNEVPLGKLGVPEAGDTEAGDTGLQTLLLSL